MATDSELKARENRARRLAEAQGLRLQKSRRRNPKMVGFGGYQLVDAETDAMIFGGWPIERWDFRATLEEIEPALEILADDPYHFINIAQRDDATKLAALNDYGEA